MKRLAYTQIVTLHTGTVIRTQTDYPSLRPDLDPVSSIVAFKNNGYQTAWQNVSNIQTIDNKRKPKYKYTQILTLNNDSEPIITKTNYPCKNAQRCDITKELYFMNDTYRTYWTNIFSIETIVN